MKVEFYIKDFDTPINNNLIESIEFVSSMGSICTSCQVVLKNISLDIFNTVKTGTSAVLVFSDNDSKEVYANPMMVVSYSKIPGQQTTFSDTMKIQFKHSFYFYDDNATLAHGAPLGLSVSDIISNVAASKLTDYFSIKIDKTTDRPAIRYQLAERSLTFFEKIMKYAQKDTFPAYLYLAADNCLYLKCISNVLSSQPTHYMYPILSLLSDTVTSESKLYNKLIMQDYKFGADCKTTSSATQNIFTTQHFRTSGKSPSGLLLQGSEVSDLQTEIATPVQTVFYSWANTPSDALAQATKASFELNNQTATLSVSLSGLYIKEVIPGTVVRVLLPQQPSEDLPGKGKVSLGEGLYMIDKAIISLKGSQHTTKLHLIYIAP